MPKGFSIDEIARVIKVVLGGFSAAVVVVALLAAWGFRASDGWMQIAIMYAVVTGIAAYLGTFWGKREKLKWKDQVVVVTGGRIYV